MTNDRVLRSLLFSPCWSAQAREYSVLLTVSHTHMPVHTPTRAYSTEAEIFQTLPLLPHKSNLLDILWRQYSWRKWSNLQLVLVTVSVASPRGPPSHSSRSQTVSCVFFFLSRTHFESQNVIGCELLWRKKQGAVISLLHNSVTHTHKSVSTYR